MYRKTIPCNIQRHFSYSVVSRVPSLCIDKVHKDLSDNDFGCITNGNEQKYWN